MNLKKNKTEIELLIEINDRLKDLTSIIAISNKDLDAQISYLVMQGYSNSEISLLLGVPKGTIDTKRAKKKKK